MRTVSDPLNLPNSSGVSTLGIQGFSQWKPVYPGYAQLRDNTLTSILTGNTFSLGNSLGDDMYITPALNKSVHIDGRVLISSIIVNGQINATTIVSPNIGATLLSASTLTVSTLNVANSVYNTITATTVNSTNENTTNFQAQGRVALSYGGFALPQGGVTIGRSIDTPPPNDGESLAVGNNIWCKSLTVSPTDIGASIAKITGLTTVNGQPYPPISPGGGVPVGSVIMFAGANAPAGFLICDGTSYSSTDPTYSALYASISTAYGGTPGATFNVPDLRTKTVFGASGPGFQGDTTPWPSTIGAVSFSELQAEFSGTVVPNGTLPNGRGALAVKSIPLGYELQVGMRVQASSGSTDTGIHIIVQILNYNGNGGTYSNPNYPVLIINPPLSADTNSSAQFTVTPIGPYDYRLANSTTDNYYTQATTDVPAHTHGNKKGGVLGNIGSDTNVPIGDPTNASAQITQGVTTNYYYSVGNPTLGQPATVFNIGTSMNVRPSMVVMNFIIKY